MPNNEEQQNLGFKVRLWLRQASPYEIVELELRNVTEIHFNYRRRQPVSSRFKQSMVAFESDIHGTGVTYHTEYIAEFEAVLEAELADDF